MMRKPFSAIVALAGAVLLASCSTVPETGRRQVDLVDDTQVVKMSMAAFEQMKGQLPISKDPKYNEMLQGVGNRISQQVFWDMPLAEWEFVVFDQPKQINAFAMPGGKVGIFSGLFQIVDDEDELASVIAHEIAHVTARHTHEKLSQQMLARTGGNALAIASLGTGAGSLATSSLLGIYGLGAQAGLSGWDRKKELEADEIGIMYMARAGYDPRAAIRVMEKMVAEDGGSTGTSWFSTHPSSNERLYALHAKLDEALKAYEKAQTFGP